MRSSKRSEPEVQIAQNRQASQASTARWCRRVFDDPLTKFLAVVTAVGLAFNASWTSIAQQIDTGYEVWPKQRAGPSRTRLLQIKRWNSGFDMFWRFDTLWCLAAFLFCRVLPVGAIPPGAHSHLVALPKAAWQCPAEHLRRIVAKLAATHPSCGRKGFGPFWLRQTVQQRVAWQSLAKDLGEITYKRNKNENVKRVSRILSTYTGTAMSSWTFFWHWSRISLSTLQGNRGSHQMWHHLWNESMWMYEYICRETSGTSGWR